MSLDFSLYYDVDHKGDLDGGEVCDGKHYMLEANITHNLNKMAKAAGIYECLWRPEEHNYIRAKEIRQPLRLGVAWLEDNPEEAKEHNPSNGWGSYEGLLSFARRVLIACTEYPNALIEANR